MDINQRFIDVVQSARALMTKHGVGHWRFGFDRSKTSYGTCYPFWKKITVSKYFCADLSNDIEDIKDTILHEIAHALMQKRHPHVKSSHGILWQSIAKEIGCKNPCRRSNKGTMPRGKYRAFCPQCGDLDLYKHRRSPAMKAGRWVCVKCRSNLTWRI